MINFKSAEWREVVEEIDHRIHALDVKNRAQLDAVATAHIRGQIAALQSLLNWELNAAIPDQTEEMIPPP